MDSFNNLCWPNCPSIQVSLTISGGDNFVKYFISCMRRRSLSIAQHRQTPLTCLLCTQGRVCWCWCSTGWWWCSCGAAARAPRSRHGPPASRGSSAGSPGSSSPSSQVQHNIYTISTQYLHSIYTVSKQYLHSIYRVSTHYLNTNLYRRDSSEEIKLKLRDMLHTGWHQYNR